MFYQVPKEQSPRETARREGERRAHCWAPPVIRCSWSLEVMEPEPLTEETPSLQGQKHEFCKWAMRPQNLHMGPQHQYISRWLQTKERSPKYNFKKAHNHS